MGSVRQLATASKALTLAKSYQPYGTVLSSTGSGASMYGYTGEQTDNTGLVFLRARYYAPAQGRFLTADTWAGNYRQPLTLNKWLYTNGNPANFTDPSGHFLETPADVFFVGMDLVLLTVDIGLIAFGPESQRSHWEQQARIDTAALAIDLLFAAIPGATGGGLMFRAAMQVVGRGRAVAIACGVPVRAIQAVQAASKIAQIPGRYGPLMHLMSDEGPSGGGGGSRGGGGGNGNSGAGNQQEEWYYHSDGKLHPGFDPTNANKPVKLGYGENLNAHPEIPGVSINDSWLESGLASLQEAGKGWQDELLSAMKNSNTINFIVDGMDIFGNPQRFTDPKVVRTHWEMDEIMINGYTNKLHLWNNGAEVTGQPRLDWIQQWQTLRGVP